jgi:hypothetical protein
MKKILVIFFALILIGIGVWRVVQSPSTDPNSETTTAAGTAAPAPLLKPATEIPYFHEIAVRDLSLAADWKDLQISCPKEHDESSQVGFIMLPGGVKAMFMCVDQYMAGVSLTYDSHGEKRQILLGQEGADAGENWDLRAWVFKEGSKITLQYVKLASFTEDGSAKPTCEAQSVVLVWNAKDQDFVKVSESHDFKIAKFQSPIQVAPDCLNAEGLWKTAP